jgi:hypothetical protein
MYIYTKTSCSTEELCSIDCFYVELSLNRTIVTDPVNVAVTPGLVFRGCMVMNLGPDTRSHE